MKALPKYIEIETSRFCNRRCDWCPNGTFTDRRQQELMEWELFTKIINELAALGFNGWLAFHNYNEPLLNQRLEAEVEAVSRSIPNCKPSIFTNGDVLTANRLDSLVASGVRYLRVTLYPRSAGATTDEKTSISAIESYIQSKDLSALCAWNFSSVRQGWAGHGNLGHMAIEIISPNIATYNWRGGTSPNFVGAFRTAPCAMTRSSASIDYKGQMKMCCNVFLEDIQHEPFRVGDLNSSTFEDSWFSKTMNEYRIAHGKADWTLSAICKHCSHTLPSI